METMDALERLAARRRLGPEWTKGYFDSWRDDDNGKLLPLTDEALREACRERHGYTGAQVDAWVWGYRDSALISVR